MCVFLILLCDKFKNTHMAPLRGVHSYRVVVVVTFFSILSKDKH